MYSKEDLVHYKYFDNTDTSIVLDSLTGVVARQYILDYARTLIKHNYPFAMCMLDLDNFKLINDSFGHSAGDDCLKMVGEGLQKYIGCTGLVGRFGGDEFIIIYLRSNTYDNVHKFLQSLYDSENAPLRKSFTFGEESLFVTGTVGSVSYPADAGTYDELFLKMDKALYRGKMKGRNCFIIYVHEKHKDIVINERGNNTLSSKMADIKRIILNGKKIKDIYRQTLYYLFDAIHPVNIFFVDKKDDVYSTKDDRKYHYGKDAYDILNELLGEKDLFSATDTLSLAMKYPRTKDYIITNQIHSFVLVRSGEGILILYESSVTRMWQDHEFAILEFATSLLSLVEKYNS
ncbi:MAG: GGDEF domain-containing protein [Acholeplasmatales bacterium]|nr:GGDEF domain-containing protein [Acholeplasmatales bacterium]